MSNNKKHLKACGRYIYYQANPPSEKQSPVTSNQPDVSQCVIEREQKRVQYLLLSKRTKAQSLSCIYILIYNIQLRKVQKNPLKVQRKVYQTKKIPTNLFLRPISKRRKTTQKFISLLIANPNLYYYNFNFEKKLTFNLYAIKKTLFFKETFIKFIFYFID